jgi:DNA repair protein RadC
MLRLLSALELGQRVHVGVAQRDVVQGAEDVAEMMAPRLGGLQHEQMWVVSLNGTGGLNGLREVARGGRHGLVVTAREILALALADAAAGFVLVHNHPSGRADPSPEDITMTQAVAEAAEVVGVPLLDHVIIGAGGGHCSLLEEGYIDREAIHHAGAIAELPLGLSASSSPETGEARASGGPGRRKRSGPSA